MYQLRQQSLVFTVSTLLILGPILSCCAEMIDLAHSSQTELISKVNIAISNTTKHHDSNHSTSMTMPCHEMTIAIDKIESTEIESTETNKIVHPANENSAHCGSGNGCITMMAQEKPNILEAHTLNDSEFEPLYFLVILDFPKARQFAVSPERPPDNLHPSPVTPITLHQMLTI